VDRADKKIGLCATAGKPHFSRTVILQTKHLFGGAMENGRAILGSGEVRVGHAVATEAGGWVARGQYSAFGVSFGVMADDISAYHLLLDRLPPGSENTPTKSVSRSYSLRTSLPQAEREPVSFSLLADQTLILRSTDLDDIADAFESDVRCHVASSAPRRVFIRAGVVGWRDRAILLPGGPRTGKSTLVRALVRCGATCFSDEYAVLDGNTVYPYPSRLPIWTEPGLSGSLLSDELGEITEPGPLSVGIVVFAPYQSGAVWKPKLLSRGRLLLNMLKHAVAAQSNPDQVLKMLDQVSKNCNSLEGVRGDAHGVATFLLDRLV